MLRYSSRSPAYLERRAKWQLTIAECTKTTKCRDTMRRIAQLSRQEAKRAHYQAIIAYNNSATEELYHHSLFWVLREREGECATVGEIRTWREVRLMSTIFKKPLHEIVADLVMLAEHL